ncbi:MAG: hypothetical protein JKX76_03750 [Colwellia sp.]|nr:hypothetical protein [Colwellia sp.]
MRNMDMRKSLSLVIPIVILVGIFLHYNYRGMFFEIEEFSYTGLMQNITEHPTDNEFRNNIRVALDDGKIVGDEFSRIVSTFMDVHGRYSYDLHFLEDDLDHSKSKTELIQLVSNDYSLEEVEYFDTFEIK